MKVVTAKNLLTDPVAVLAGIGCLGLLVLAGLGLSGPKGKPSAAYTHLHCPSCKVEITYSAEKDGQRCKACLAGASFVPTVGPFQETGSMDASSGGRNWGRVVGRVLFIVLVLEAFVFTCALRLRALKRAALADENRLLTGQCPFCQRKIRFPAAKDGTGILCPKCKTAFTLTGTADANQIA